MTIIFLLLFLYPQRNPYTVPPFGILYSQPILQSTFLPKEFLLILLGSQFSVSRCGFPRQFKHILSTPLLWYPMQLYSSFNIPSLHYSYYFTQLLLYIFVLPLKFGVPHIKDHIYLFLVHRIYWVPGTEIQ